MNADELRELIRSAFHNVTLDDGISIRQGEICDNYGTDNDGKRISEEEFAAIPRGEITDDWTSIPLAELERHPYVPYLDAKGYRYYIPAFLLSLLEDTQAASMRLISALSSLFPTRDMWSHRMQQYELLSRAQRAAIAEFLFHFQNYPTLESTDRSLVSVAFQTYWQQYLPPEHESKVT